MPLWFSTNDVVCSETKLPSVVESEGCSGKWLGRTLASLSDTVREDRPRKRKGQMSMGRPRTSNPFLDYKLDVFSREQSSTNVGKNICKPLNRQKPHAVDVWKHDEIDRSRVRLTDRPTTANPCLDRLLTTSDRSKPTTFSSTDKWMPDTLDNCYRDLTRPVTTKSPPTDFVDLFEKGQSTNHQTKPTIELVNPDSFQVLWCADDDMRKSSRRLNFDSKQVKVRHETRRSNQQTNTKSSVAMNAAAVATMFSNLRCWESSQQSQNTDTLSELIKSEVQHRSALSNSEFSQRKALIDLESYCSLSGEGNGFQYIDSAFKEFS
eukprot:TRINITY_DN35688_c0_g1_i1.p1 TRINITY_DN35688_c0_g1~~TRINITY_DN35688_c0_g1_i1.p1  ORF type:complete len:321 (+),score=46.82 TRINITY_DN35688_c0_g1_i1:189-1151(+)